MYSLLLWITLTRLSLIWCSQYSNGSLVSNSSDLDPLWYLNRFGYLDTKTSKKSANLIMLPTENSTNPIVTIAIKKFQKFAGLNQTGIIDEDTKKMMKTPRCGHPDKLDDDLENKNRKRRYALQGSKWPKSNIRFKIAKYPEYGLMSKKEIKNELKRAFDLWSESSNLEFELVDEIKIDNMILSETEKSKQKANVDIEVRFERGYHGDSEPFDGSGMILGHAYFPEFGGSTHFDADEFWTKNSPNGVNLYQVAVHEFGHALGLEHSENFDAIMAPFFRGYTPDFKLNSDDLTGIEMLYGPSKKKLKKKPKIFPNFRNNMPNVYRNDLDLDLSKYFPIKPDTTKSFKIMHSKPKASKPSMSTRPYLQKKVNKPEYFDPSSTISLCFDGKFDAITVLSDGFTYIFKDSLVYRIDSNFRVDNSYPKKINNVFKGKNGLTYMNLPTKLDSVLYVPENGLTYFFKNNLYWRSSKLYELDPGYPRLISDSFRGLNAKNGFNGKIDASFVWSGNRRVYFIEDNKYWRFDFESGSIEPGYPKSLSVWRGLPSRITSAFLWINGITYFFDNDRYYRFNDLAFKVEENAIPSYPRLNKDFWFGCNNLNRFGKLILNSTSNDDKKKNNEVDREEKVAELEKQQENNSSLLNENFYFIFFSLYLVIIKI